MLTDLLAHYIRDKWGTPIRGKKSYIISAIGTLTALYMLATGEVPTYQNPTPVSPDEAFMLLLNSLGIGTLRAGIKKGTGQ